MRTMRRQLHLMKRLKSALALGAVSLLVFGLGLGELSGVALAAQKKAVLLTSVDTSQIKAPFYLKKYFKNYTKRLGRIFEDRLEDDFSIEVIHKANQEDLWKTLHSPDVDAVFWVSHAAGAAAAADGTEFSGAIVDIKGFDVTPVFSEIHPNIRFVAVVGCQAKGLLEKLKPEIQKNNPDVVLYAFDKKVDAKKGLKKAIKVLRRIPPRTGMPICPKRVGYPLTLNRKFPPGKFTPAVRIENRGRVLGVLPDNQHGEDQMTHVYLDPPGAAPRATDFKILASAGSNPMMTSDRLELGTLSFTSPLNPENRDLWKLFSDPSGKPIGVVTHVYRFVGSLLELPAPVEYEPFSCQ